MRESTALLVVRPNRTHGCHASDQFVLVFGALVVAFYVQAISLEHRSYLYTHYPCSFLHNRSGG
jgi:hypothetical protein